MDIFNLIRISAILILLTCCIIATFTDLNKGIIPNWLTFSTIAIGIILTTFYYLKIGTFNIFYYIFIVVIFLLSYFVWKLGLWAGGDVKLFTAISTLLIPEYLSIIPSYSISFLVLPVVFREFSIPTLTLIFNSLISSLPILVIYVLYIILKRKAYLIDKLKSCFMFTDGLFCLNTLLIGYGILSYFNVYNLLLKLLFSLVFMIVINRLTNKNMAYTILTTAFLLVVTFQRNFLTTYLFEIIIIQFIMLLRNIIKNNLLSDVFTDSIQSSNLKEGMVLSKSLCIENYEYKFIDRTTLFRNNARNSDANSEVLIDSSISGLTSNDIELLNNLTSNGLIRDIPIKKSMVFGPFILSGLIITLLIGNSYELFIYLIGMVL